MNSRIASLPMYDIPEIRHFNDTFWSQLRHELQIAKIQNPPQSLTRTVPYNQIWMHQDLLFSQTCGYPFVSSLWDQVKLIATPVYSVPGCSGPYYRSWLISRDDTDGKKLKDFYDKPIAINDWDSLSGCKTIELMLNGHLETYFDTILLSGGHAKSIDMVQHRLADIAAIDCVTWHLIKHYQPHAIKGLRIVDSGPSLPGLPYITAASTDVSEIHCIQSSLTNVIKDSNNRDLLNKLFLVGIETLDKSVYMDSLGDTLK
jgi:ABC-type phosphate/phosphonate transport system substrate-binding protein